MERFFYIVPRILPLLFVAFLSLFALDVFNEYQGANVIFPLLIHLIPSFVLLVIIVIAWRHPLVGATVFIASGILYILEIGAGRPWGWYVFIAGPALLIGVMYLTSWAVGKRDGTEAPRRRGGEYF